MVQQGAEAGRLSSEKQGIRSMNNTTPPETGPGNPVVQPGSLVARVKALLLTPKTEWPMIEAEQAGIADLISRYAVVVALIPAAATFVRSAFVGTSFLGLHVTQGIGPALALAFGQYLVSLLAVALVALVIAVLAPLFGGTGNRASAFRLAIYASTASWVAGIFAIVPSLAFLNLLGLYSLYLIYTGLPPVLRVAPEKAGTLTAVIAVAAIAVSLLASRVMGPVAGMVAGLMSDTDTAITGPQNGPTLTLPNGDTVDTGKLHEASEKLKDATRDGGAAKAVDPQMLKALLPETLAGYRRGAVEIQSMGAAGVGGAQASAQYEANGKRLTVEITDMAAVGALTGLGAALNVRQEKETADGFERTRVEDGQIVKEEWSKSTGSGRYERTLANRFMVSAVGEAESFDRLKAAADGIDAARLKALAPK